ncbi:3811_t:CDS:2, partial [Cetraspora pellucida]
MPVFDDGSSNIPKTNTRYSSEYLANDLPEYRYDNKTEQHIEGTNRNIEEAAYPAEAYDVSDCEHQLFESSFCSSEFDLNNSEKGKSRSDLDSKTESPYGSCTPNNVINDSNKYGFGVSTGNDCFSNERINYSLNYPHTPGGGNQHSRTIYTAWSSDNLIPVSKEEIEDIFIDLTNKFGFQKDSMRNMFDNFMCILDSRASRMAPSQALLTLHADYIGGVHANYRKWYFATQMYLDDALSDVSIGITFQDQKNVNIYEQWNKRMNRMSQYDRVRQLALWFLLWGEAAQIRFTSECLCFIFKLADDYAKSPEYKAKVLPVPEGEYLKNVITPLYKYIRDQSYEIIDGTFVKREKDHADTIGYDDINQLFWYPESINRIVLQDKGSPLMALPSSQRYKMLSEVDWNHVFEKTYKEKRTWFHLAINFTRIWIIHVAVFWYYTAYNAPFLYTDPEKPVLAVQLSIVALGGAVSTLFMIVGCICEFFFIPLNTDNISMLSRRLTFLFVILVINAAPTYIVIKARTTQISLIIGIIQLVISLLTTLTFAIIPSANLFGGSSKSSQKYQAFKTYTASYPILSRTDRAISIGLWCCIFGCKMIESYFFLSLSFKDPLKAMVNSRVLHCGDRLVGGIICSYMP